MIVKLADKPPDVAVTVEVQLEPTVWQFVHSV